MNTSEKGRRYEWAYKRELISANKANLVVRAAASHGPFDLIAIDDYGAVGVQLKAGKISCRAAEKLATSLWMGPVKMSAWFGVRVVHRTKEKEFCEH
jgi:hypothetical protein